MSDPGDIPTLLRSLAVFPRELAEFDPDQTPDTPLELFIQWLRLAVADGVLAPHAANLATVGTGHAPDARVVILSDVSVHGWSFATSRESPKGRQLEAIPKAALTFFWPEVGRQIRVRGPVTTSGAAENASDFTRRHPAARALVLAGRQSTTLRNRSDLDEAVAASRQRVVEDPGLSSPLWTVYTVSGQTVEFWQADPDRRHTRLRYRRKGNHWVKERLWP